ncbi:MAG: choline ABC transporter ATP-binding protein [Thiolinea sp.]
MAVVSFEQVDIIFGNSPHKALSLLDQGAQREEILEKTGQVLGAADASLAIEEGEICVLMGLSGSGKSTLLRAVNGLNTVTRGHLFVEHQGQQIDVANCNSRTLRELRTGRIAMVFQQFALLPWRTVRENVGLGLELKGVSKAQRKKVVDEKLELVGLSQWADKYAHELSGGMQQRVGLARAFATDADILLMDEPFSALDPLIRDKLQDELLDLQRELKKTIIFVSHDLDEAMKIGSHIAIMEGGRIVQYGTPEAIVLAPENDYVAEFVAHMNPLNVLKASSLMRPAAELVRENGGNGDNGDNGHYRFGSFGEFQLSLHDNGEIAKVSVNGQPADWAEHSAGAPENTPQPGTFICAAPDTLMRTIIGLRQQSGLPVLLTDRQQFTGIIGDDEIYRGLLRKP